VTRRLRLVVLGLAALGLTSAVHAALPTFWQVSTEADFLRGEVENLSIDSYGQLTLGPTSTPVYDSSAPFLWTVVALPDGSVYAGSGNEGQVFRVDAAGKGGVFFDSEELEVHAIAPAPGGGLYVGTSPQGKIYKVDTSGKGSVFFDPDDRYIWSLVVDRSGNVFAGTGDKGVIYKITPDGKGTVFYQTKATHAMTLALDRDGRLLAGTESPGRVFRIDQNGKPFVILESSFNEIRTIRVAADGTTYAIAVSSRVAGTPGTSSPPPAPADSGPTPVVTVSAEVTAIGIAEPSGSGPPPQQTPRSTGPVTGAIYRISTDGASDLLWELREDTPYDLAFESNGNLLVATGNKGKIYRLSGEPTQPTLVVRANVQQVTAVLPEKDGRMLFATANPGKLLRLSATRADRGTYISDVRDAQTVAAWGTIRWRSQTPAGTRIEISTRSGNTRTPDETWSDWASAYTNQTGSTISSPRARYLQWRAVLSGARGESPLLTSVSAAYLPRNLRPRVTSITIHPSGTVFQRPFPTDPEIAGFDGDLPDRRNAAATPPGGPPSLGRRVYQKGLLTFVWRAEDDNKDDLSFDVLYRREGETSWKILKRNIVDPIVVWDTTSVPNGTYLLRIVASDAPSNSPSTALTGALESSSFDIDNAPPEITISSVRRDGARLILEFEARDEYSSVLRADYSLDGDRWQTIYPKDGIADSRVEQFELVLEGEAAARGVIVRVADALNNVASARGEAPTPSAGSGRR
jgi:hypothetical protein